MRNLIRKMPDLAEMVLDKCISDNGKRPVADDYAVRIFCLLKNRCYHVMKILWFLISDYFIL